MTLDYSLATYSIDATAVPHDRPQMGRRSTWQEPDPPGIPERPGWHSEAACREADPGLFFPDTTPGGRAATANATAAKAICATCPVRVTCLEHALTHPERDGVWGGKSPRERQRMRGLRRRGAG